MGSPAAARSTAARTRVSRNANPTAGGASGEELTGGLVRGELERLARVRDDERAAHRRPELLVGVGHLVRDQLAPRGAARLVLAGAEEDVAPGRERAGGDGAGERGGGRVRVDADVGHRAPEHAPELLGETVVERHAAAARGG